MNKLISEFYEKKYNSKINYLVSRYRITREDAEDIIQEALIKICNTNINAKGFFNYLDSIIHNELINFIAKANKRKRVRPFEIKDLSDYKMNCITDTVSVEEVVIKRELLADTGEELRLFINGYSYVEIAGIKKISIGAVKSRIKTQRDTIKNGNKL